MESYSNRLHRHSRPEPVRQANTLSDYTLEQILELKFNDREKYIPIQTFDQWIRAKVADQLRKNILGDNVGKLAKDRGLLVLGHIVIIIGSRHILMWDMNREGMLADKPYLVDEKRE